MGDSAGMRRRPPLSGGSVKVEREEYDVQEESENIDTNIDQNDHIRLNSMFENVKFADSESLFESLQQIKCYLERELLESQSYTRQIILFTFSKSLKDRSFAVKAGALYGIIHTMKIQDETVRSILLSSIQKELEENDFQEGNRSRFLNAIFLLSELYYHLRIDDNPVSVLGVELMKYFRWLLTGDEREIEVLAICLITNGAALKKDKPASYRKLLVEIRIALITRDLLNTSKSWLLLILDTDGVNFERLHDDVLICHMTFIGDRGFKKLKRMKPAIKTMPAISTNNKSSVAKTHVQPVISSAQAMCEKRQSVENRDKLPQNQRTSSESCFPARHSPDAQTTCRRSSFRRSSEDRRHSPDHWDSPDRLNLSDQGSSPEELQYSSEHPKSILKTPRRTSNDYKSNDIRLNDFRSSDHRSNDYKSNNYNLSDYKSNNNKSNDCKLTDHKSNDYKQSDSSDYKANAYKSYDESSNFSGRSEGRNQHNQSSGLYSGQKVYRGRRSADVSGYGGNKTERRNLPPWREHDDRFDRDYEN